MTRTPPRSLHPQQLRIWLALAGAPLQGALPSACAWLRLRLEGQAQIGRVEKRVGVMATRAATKMGRGKYGRGTGGRAQAKGKADGAQGAACRTDAGSLLTSVLRLWRARDCS